MQGLTRDTIAVQCLNSPLLNLRIINVKLHKFGETEIAVLGWLLENVPDLEAMSIQIPPPSREAAKNENCREFLRRMLEFRRSSSHARVVVAESI